MIFPFYTGDQFIFSRSDAIPNFSSVEHKNNFFSR